MRDNRTYNIEDEKRLSDGMVRDYDEITAKEKYDYFLSSLANMQEGVSSLQLFVLKGAITTRELANELERLKEAINKLRFERLSL